MNDDDSAGLDVHPFPRLSEQHGQRAAERDEDLFLVGIEMPAAASVGRVTPHPRARLGHLRGLGERGGLPWLLALVTGPLLPLETVEMDDVVAHDEILRVHA